MSHVPPTFSDKEKRLAAVVEEHIEAGGVYSLEIRHDDDCPTLKTQSLRDCTCDPEYAPPKKLA